MTDDIKNLSNYEDQISEDDMLNINEAPLGDVDGDTHVAQNVHHASFQSLSLRSELIRAIDDNGFEQPSEVQVQTIPPAILGNDIICQAKSGMGKTAVFVLSVLHLMEPEESPRVRCLVLCHARELAYQIQWDFNRFKKYFVNKSNGECLIKTKVVLGGTPIAKDKKALQTDVPQIVIGTPGRTLDLVRSGSLNLDHVKYFIVDECDKVLGPNSSDMRNDIQTIFYKMPRNKQVMMFSATLDDEVRNICKYFMHNPREIIIDEGKKLRLDGLQQYCVMLPENKKNEKLISLLDMIDFNQVFIFVSSIKRANTLNTILNDEGFPAVVSHSGLSTEERIERFKKFKVGSDARIMISTDLFHRGMDFKSVNVVINYDMASEEDTYLHRIGRAGRFGTKGLAVSFISTPDDEKILADVRTKFVVPVDEMPDTIDKTTYR